MVGPTGASHNYPVALKDNLRGKRAMTRKTRPSQPTDPSMLLTRRWKLSGPLGKSRQGEDGSLGCEYATLDHRFDDLLTSLPAVSTLTLTAYDPLASGAAKLGAFALGSVALGAGTSLASPLTVSHIAENAGRFFLARGAFVSQVNISSWTLEATKTLAAMVYGMANWFRKLRLGMGGTLALQTVTGIGSSGSTYTATQVSATDVLAKELTVGNDRLVMVRADPAGTNENRIRWTLDDFVSLSGGASGAGFFVGDPGVGATGLGTMGPYTLVGSETGIYGFTDEGVPFNALRALADARSTENGRKMAYQFGWNYEITTLGLYATRPGPVSNPVGLGSPAWRDFEGFDGRPVAVLAWRELLLCCYESTAGTAWRILAGEFGPMTDATGELNWYLLAARTNASVKTLGATATPSNPHIVWGEGSGTLARILMGRSGRDILDANYVFGVAGGQWFGTSLMEQQHLRKTLRYGRCFTENMASGNTWQLALSYDGAAYANVGSAVTTAGAQKIIPATPTSAPTGFSPKPRLTQVAGAGTAATTPPQLRGYLELCFDLRPDKVDEVTVICGPLSREDVNRLRALADGEDATGRQPVEIRLPDSPSTLRYGYVLDVEDEDATATEVVAAAVRLLTWETS